MFRLSCSIAETAAQLPISEVVLRLAAPTSAPEEHRFDLKNAPRPWTLTATAQSGGYSYRVIFEAGRAPDYESPICNAGPQGNIVIDDFGVRLFLTPDIDFTVVQRIVVSYLSLDGLRTFVLNATNRTRLLFAGIDYPAGAPLSYSLEYEIADGNYRQSNLTAAQSLVLVPYPFVAKTTVFRPIGIAGPDPTVLKIQLKMEHHEDGPDWRIAAGPRHQVIDRQNPDCAWTYQTVEPDRALMLYSGSIVMSGRINQIFPTECKLTVIPIGDTPPYNSVTIMPDRVHWELYRAVAVELSTGNPSDREAFTFTADSLSEFWGYFSAKPSYRWAAQYEQIDGSIVTIRPQKAFAPVLTLPSEPGVAEWALA